MSDNGVMTFGNKVVCFIVQWSCSHDGARTTDDSIWSQCCQGVGCQIIVTKVVFMLLKIATVIDVAWCERAYSGPNVCDYIAYALDVFNIHVILLNF